MKEQSVNFSTAKTVRHIVIFFLLFLAGELFSSVLFDIIFRVVTLPQTFLYYVLRSAGCLALTWCFFLLYTKKGLHLRMEDFRITFCLKGWNVLLAVLLPMSVIAVLAFVGKGSVTYGLSAVAVVGIIFDALFRAFRAGILEEMLFRGYIMKLLESRWGKYTAVLLPSFVFSLSHIPSMTSFSVAGVVLLIVGGTLVGVMFSLIAYKSNSVCGSAAVHIVWNFLMGTNVIHFFAGEDMYGTSIFSIKLPTENVLLTGGGFGVEVSFAAVLGYALVCGLLIYSMRKEDAQ